MSRITKPVVLERRPKAADDATFVERLLLRIDYAPSGCWLWTGAKTRGYGSMRIQGVQWLTHRAAYVAFVGAIPDGMTVDHMCFTPACFNPGHLRLLTHAENCSNQQSTLTPHCSAGHAFTEANTSRRPGRGRVCRTCRAARCRDWRESRKAAL